MGEALLGAIIGAIGGFLVGKGLAKPDEIEELLRQIRDILKEEVELMRTAREVRTVKQLFDSKFAKPVSKYAMHGLIGKAEYDIYKVPNGKVFYLLWYSFNVWHTGAGTHLAIFRIKQAPRMIFSYLRAPDAVDQMNDSNYGILHRGDEGTTYQLYVSDNTGAILSIFGIEIDRA